MGKKHREERKKVKAVLHQFGVKENEFGELRQVRSKGEVRRQLASRALKQHVFESAVIAELSKSVSEDIDKEMLGEAFGLWGK